MRWTAALLVLLLFGMLIQARILAKRSEERYQTAIALLPAQPLKAYEEMKPAFPTSNLLTLGRAARNQRDFFIVMRDKMIGRIASQRDLHVDWIGPLVECLQVFQAAMQENTLRTSIKEPLPNHIKMIFATLFERRDQIANSSGLASWDTLVRDLRRIEHDGIVTEQLVPGLSDFLNGLNRIDREGIAWRETLTVARDELGNGVIALGLPSSSNPQGPLVARLDRQIPDNSLLKAEEHFARGKLACVKFGKSFGQRDGTMPPELEALWGRLAFNIAAIRVAHIIDHGPALASAASYYLTKLYVSPGTDTIPTDAEIFAAFTNATGEELAKAGETFARLDDSALGGERNACLAIVHWTAIGFNRTLGRPQIAATEAGRYQTMRSSEMKTEAARNAMNELSTSDYPLIFVR